MGCASLEFERNIYFLVLFNDFWRNLKQYEIIHRTPVPALHVYKTLFPNRLLLLLLHWKPILNEVYDVCFDAGEKKIV